MNKGVRVARRRMRTVTRRIERESLRRMMRKEEGMGVTRRGEGIRGLVDKGQGIGCM